MTKLLVVNSSPNREWSISRRLVDSFVESYTSVPRQVDVTHRDVGANPPPHLTDVVIGAYFARAELTAEQHEALALSNELVREFLDADVVVIGAPMHNFGVTSGLKAYIDHIVRAGRTFMFSLAGPAGLAAGKKLYVLTARGSDYTVGGPLHAMDFQETYLRIIFGFIGITDVTFIHCQGVAVSDDARSVQLANALSTIRKSFAPANA